MNNGTRRARHRPAPTSDLLDVFQSAAVPILVTDGHARILLVNREASRLLEARPGTAPSPQMRDLEANHEKLTRFIGDLLLRARVRHGGRLVLVDPDEARELPVLAVSTKILDERGDPRAVVTVLLDLTQEVENRQRTWTTGELTRRNTQLEEQRTVLERSARLKNEFLATMSHELRTPINAVLGYNALLKDGLFGPLSERQRDALDRMRNAAERLLALINDVLDLSRVEAGRVALSPVTIDWPTFLETLSEAVRPLAAHKTLTYGVVIEPELPSIRTDEMRLRQVLFNLLSNAVKFTDRGWLELRVRAAAGGSRVQIDVTDTGIGIDEADLDTIFDEFTQVDQSSTREHGGAGLGLAISRRLIRLMGGSLTVKSVPGRGSTFRVELPLVPPGYRDLVTTRPVGDRVVG
jgi:signal transduction histidine kinase